VWLILLWKHPLREYLVNKSWLTNNFVFGANFHIGEEKKPWQIQQKVFWELKERKLPYLEKKN
jgi:hypothetical protein